MQHIGTTAAEGHLAHHERSDEQHHVGGGEAQAHLLTQHGADKQHGRDGEGYGGQHRAEVEVHGPLQLIVDGRLDGANRLGSQHDTGHDKAAERLRR